MDTKDYRSDCPISSTLDLIGDKWTLLILRDMMFGAQRFSDFLTSAEAMKRNILSGRLKRLTDYGLVLRVPYQDHPPRFRYQLTTKGAALLPVVQAMAAWGAAHLDHAYDPPPELLGWEPSDHA